jgi:hypothetical protein
MGLLLEPGDAGRVLGLSASRVRALADEGHLPVAAYTKRHLRLFRPEDVPDLLRELRGLERRRGASGSDRVDHRPGSHDDLAAAASGVVAALASGAADAPGFCSFDEGLGRYVDSRDRGKPGWDGPGVATFE